MFDTLMHFGLPASAGLALAGGTLLAALGHVVTTRRKGERYRHDAQRARRMLRAAQAELEQARRCAEALEDEVMGWRRRSALGGNVRSAARAMPVSPSPKAQDWVISVLLDGDDSHRGSGSASTFADTQVQLGAAH